MSSVPFICLLGINQYPTLQAPSLRQAVLARGAQYKYNTPVVCEASNPPRILGSKRAVLPQTVTKPAKRREPGWVAPPA